MSSMFRNLEDRDRIELAYCGSSNQSASIVDKFQTVAQSIFLASRI
jgi:hypothetical protein